MKRVNSNNAKRKDLGSNANNNHRHLAAYDQAAAKVMKGYQRKGKR